jgi:DNA-binding SARP family transcriptional activator
MDRVAVALAALPGADVAHRVEGLLARDRLECAGVPPGRCGPAEPARPVAIRALGRFEVIVNGAVVPPAEWRSRKARDLLRILVSQRGRPVPREHLVELLWGGDEKPARLAHRLSVALSTVRGVLDPDRLAATDQLVLADSTSVALDVTQVSVDLEAFLLESAHGLRLRERGDPEDARAALAAAERRYTGDFLAGEPYEDWARAAREEARAAYLHTARALAHLCRRSGRVDEAVRYLLRLLDHDPYDERAHLDLVDLLAESGRHGESRRARDRYLAAMTEIGITPAPPSRPTTATAGR